MGKIQSKLCQDTHKEMISNYLCAIICSNKTHVRHRYAYCDKYCKYLCFDCKANSRYIGFQYLCFACHRSFCIKHSLMHNDSILHTFKGGSLTIYNSNIICVQAFPCYATLTNFDSISLHGRIFIMGGTSDKVYEMNIKKKEFIKKASMLKLKSKHSLCTFKTFIYSIGGYNGDDSLKDCEKYDKWNNLSDLIEPRCEAAVFVFNLQYIYAFGGYKHLNSIEKLNITLTYGKWKSVQASNPPLPRYQLH